MPSRLFVIYMKFQQINMDSLIIILGTYTVSNLHFYNKKKKLIFNFINSDIIVIKESVNLS